MRNDALKLAEEALEPFELFGKYVADNPRSGAGDALYGWDNAEEATLRQSDLKRAVAAACAIRAARAERGWRPIEEMERVEDDGVAVGRWVGLEWVTDYPFCSQPNAVRSGYTHFYRPQLPPPPAREEVGNE